MPLNRLTGTPISNLVLSWAIVIEPNPAEIKCALAWLDTSKLRHNAMKQRKKRTGADQFKLASDAQDAAAPNVQRGTKG